MTNKIYKILFTFLAISGYAKAQSLANSIVANQSTVSTSAYSGFGLGEQTYNGTAENVGKGGLAVAVVNYFSPTYNNAASFYHTKLTTFQVGIKLSEKHQLTATSKNWSNNGALNYASLAFPVNKWWGCGVGLIPAYAQGYNIKKDSVPSSFGLTKYEFSGKGSTNKLAFNNAINPFKWFSDSLAQDFAIGIGVAYMFGTTRNYTTLEYFNYNGLGYNNHLIYKENSYSGLMYNAGLIHKFRIAKTVEMSVGASYDFQSKINNNRTIENYNYIGNTIIDSVYKVRSPNEKTQLPSKLNMGFTLLFSNKLLVGLEYKNEQWSKFKNATDANFLNNSKAYILGLEYNPHKPNGGFFSNTNYRFGLRYTQLPYSINGAAIAEKAVSVGFGLPIKRSFSSVNIGLEMAQRGTTSKGLTQENYYSAFVALTINDRWFIKQKYD